MTLSGKQRRRLRALGHALDPVVHIGKDGLSDAFVAAADRALADHELIKVRILDTTELPRHEAAEGLAERTGSQVAQVLGNTFLLYRRRVDQPEIEL